MKLNAVKATPRNSDVIYADVLFELEFDGQVIGALGVQQPNLMERTLYLSFLPADALRPSPCLFRGLRREFRVFDSWALRALIRPGDTRAARFAHFFGLAPTTMISNHILFERAAHGSGDNPNRH